MKATGMPVREGSVEPYVRHVATGDGIRIASWTLGEGPPLVYLAGGPWSHIELWQVPECQLWYERLARSRMLVRSDMRGTGRSTRAVADFSLDAHSRSFHPLRDARAGALNYFRSI